ncbi:MAG: hypothetical protein ACREHC_03850 [Candidatus Levyibacteriota bacterium]
METKASEKPEQSKSKTSLIGPLDLTKEAFIIYKNNFNNFFPLYLAFGLVSALSDISNSLVKAKFLPFPLPLISSLVIVALSLYLTIVFILTLKKKIKNIELIDKEAMSKIWPVFLLELLTGLILLGGIILLIIPAFLFATWYMFGMYVLLSENLGIQTSLSRSKFYVKGHFWEVFRTQFSFGFLTMIFYLVILFIFGAVKGLFFPMIMPQQLVINLVNAIITIPLAGFISPLGIIYVFQLYKHLKAISPAQITTEKTPKNS